MYRIDNNTSQSRQTIILENKEKQYNNTTNFSAQLLSSREEILHSNYKEYGLHRNNTSELSQNSEGVYHEYLPKEYYNNEQYKYKLFEYLRDISIPRLKSENCKAAIYMKTHAYNQSQENDKYISTIPKRKKICKSQKRIYNSELYLINEKGEQDMFKIYRDSDIGISEKWQKRIIERRRDDDVMSSSGQIEGGIDVCINDIEEAIEYIKILEKMGISKYKMNNI